MVRERPAKYLRNRIVIHPFFGASILDAPENRRAGGILLLIHQERYFVL